MSDRPRKKNIVVYVPPDARINFNNSNEDSPETKYNNRIAVFDINEVSKIVKGKYGRENRKD